MIPFNNAISGHFTMNLSLFAVVVPKSFEIKPVHQQSRKSLEKLTPIDYGMIQKGLELSLTLIDPKLFTQFKRLYPKVSGDRRLESD
jgi:hypothetical protein